jgi:hypothetical protein
MLYDVSQFAPQDHGVKQDDVASNHDISTLLTSRFI